MINRTDTMPVHTELIAWGEKGQRCPLKSSHHCVGVAVGGRHPREPHGGICAKAGVPVKYYLEPETEINL